MTAAKQLVALPLILAAVVRVDGMVTRNAVTEQSTGRSSLRETHLHCMQDEFNRKFNLQLEEEAQGTELCAQHVRIHSTAMMQ